jgi:hypothetical protein
MEIATRADLGRKVFFLYPHSVIRDRLVEQIINSEYEVYLIKDHVRLLKLLERFDDVIVFVNIDDALSEPEWETYIRGIKENEKTSGVRVGIVTYYKNTELAQKYLMDLLVPCGFVVLKVGIETSTSIILKTLEANEARGRRRYVRADCTGSRNATFNARIDGKLHNGNIIDISSAGMACSFEERLDLKVGTLLEDIQLRLKGLICRVSGRLAGVSKEDSPRNVVMFDNDMGSEMRQKIRQFVHATLQDELDQIKV